MQYALTFSPGAAHEYDSMNLCSALKTKFEKSQSENETDELFRNSNFKNLFNNPTKN